MVVMTLPPRHLIRLNVLFLPGLHIFGGLARFDQNLAFFFLFLFSFFFFLKSRLGHAKSHFFFFGFSPSFICNFLYLHWLFLIEFYIWFHHYSFDFWILFFKFGIHSLNWYLFCFESFSWLIFFTILPLDIYFHLLFASNLVMLFSNYFLNGLVF